MLLTENKKTNRLPHQLENEKTSFYQIVLDLGMPVMEATRPFPKSKPDPDVPATAFTASVSDNISTRLANAGFNDFICKPFSAEERHKKIDT